jgi:hypothetical protein
VSPFLLPSSREVINAWHEGTLPTLIRATLRDTLKAPLVELGRAADLIWLGFGEIVPSPTQQLPGRRGARHRLHISCPFRLDANNGKPILAGDDIFQPASLSDGAPANFDWDKPGANRYDAIVESFWREREPGSIVVEDIEADHAGGLTLALSQGYTIRCFPNRSGLAENWRYFFLGGSDHFVVLPESAPSDGSALTQ